MEYNTEYQKENLNPSLIGIITAPKAQFERMKYSAPIIAPITIMILLIIATSLLASYVALNNPILEQINADNHTSVSPSTVMKSTAATAIIAGIMSLFLTPIFYQNIMRLFGKETTYKKLISVVVYSMIIAKIGMLLNGFIALALDGYEITYTSLAPFITGNPVLHAMAQQFDVFNIWYYIILAIGLKTVVGLEKNKAILLVIILFLVTTALRSMSGIMQGIAG